MRFVTIKSPEQQAVLMLHRTRDLLVRQRTMLVNALRSHIWLCSTFRATWATVVAVASGIERRRLVR